MYDWFFSSSDMAHLRTAWSVPHTSTIQSQDMQPTQSLPHKTTTYLTTCANRRSPKYSEQNKFIQLVEKLQDEMGIHRIFHIKLWYSLATVTVVKQSTRETGLASSILSLQNDRKTGFFIGQMVTRSTCLVFQQLLNPSHGLSLRAGAAWFSCSGLSDNPWTKTRFIISPIYL